MKINKVAVLLGLVIASVLFWEVAAHASQANQATKLTFNEPVEIPGQILPAGTYLFRLASEEDMDNIRIFNADGTRVIATIRTISAERGDRADSAVLVMAKQAAGRPDALIKWFYAGYTDGHEFVYPNTEEQQLAQDQQYTVVSQDTTEGAD